MRLVYINSGVNSVFDSQVLSLLTYYSVNAYFDDITLLFGYRKEEDIIWLEKKKIKNINVQYFKLYPNYGVYNLMNEKSMYKAILNIDQRFTNYIFHIRTELASLYFSNIRSKLGILKHQYITDVRGASIPEVQEFYRTNKMLKPFKLYNYRLALEKLKMAGPISVVSDSLKQYLKDRGISNGTRIVINPCLVNQGFFFDPKKRTELRKSMTIDDDAILIVFASGGTAQWQNNSLILKLAEMNFLVLNLSRIKIDHPNIINKFVPYADVPGYLSAADIAFIWRDLSLVNKVASPVKVSEYISCGLPVIHNGNIDQLNTFFNNKNGSLLIEKIENLNHKKVQKLKNSSNRKKLSLKGRQVYGISEIAKSYYDLYSKLLNTNETLH